MLTTRARRRGEHGQALILALAFIAFFGLVTTAVLQFADTVELQQAQSQATTASHANTEGAMLLAAQAAHAQGSCAAGSTGSITMTAGETVAYDTTACNPGATANLIADQCAACILGQTGNGQPLTVQGALTAQGPIAVNGRASVTGSAITSTVLSPSRPPGFVGCYPTCGLTSATDSSPAASILTRAPVPQVNFTPPVVPGGSDCTNGFDGTTGGQIPSGCYSSMSLECSTGACAYQMSGTYLLEGPLTIGTGTGPLTTVTAVGPSLLALVRGRRSNPGGGILINADGSLSLQGSSANGDVALYVDPSDAPGTTDVVTVAGGSLSVSGTVDAPNASVSVDGGPGTGIGTITTTPTATPDPNSGRLIVGSLNIGPYGAVSVTAAPPTPGYCWVYNDDVTVTTAARTVSGQLVVESDCSGRSGIGIISINYGS